MMAEETEEERAQRAFEEMCAVQERLPDMFEDFMEVVFKHQKDVPARAIASMLEIIKSHLVVYTSLH